MKFYPVSNHIFCGSGIPGESREPVKVHNAVYLMICSHPGFSSLEPWILKTRIKEDLSYEEKFILRV